MENKVTFEYLLELLALICAMGNITVDGKRHVMDNESSLRVEKGGAISLVDGYDNTVFRLSSYEKMAETMNELIEDGKSSSVWLGTVSAEITKTGIKIDKINISFGYFDLLSEQVAKFRKG